jgi:hypothetical protein
MYYLAKTLGCAPYELIHVDMVPVPLDDLIGKVWLPKRIELGYTLVPYITGANAHVKVFIQYG